MKLSSFLQLIAIAAAAALPNQPSRRMLSSDSGKAHALQKREPGSAFLCTKPNYTGECAWVDFGIDYVCLPIPAPFTYNLGSMYLDKGALCRLTTVTNTTTCDLHGDLFLENPGVANLLDHNGQNYGAFAHHIGCQECTNCQGEGSM